MYSFQSEITKQKKKEKKKKLQGIQRNREISHNKEKNNQ